MSVPAYPSHATDDRAAGGETRLDRLLVDSLELSVVVFGTWTLAYQLVLVTRLPARLVALPAVCGVLPAVWLWWRSRPPAAAKPIVRTTALGAAGLGSLTAILALVLARPDLDDFSFFQRAVAQIGRLGQPFVRSDTSHDILLPPLSNHHLLTSYEPLVAIAGRLLGIEPLLLYHNGAAFFAGLALTAAWMALYRHVGLGWRTTLVSTAAALAFHLLDGGPHRSFGHFGLVRLWQGKAILATVLVPLVVLFALRFLRRPSRRRLAILAMAGIAGVGLSSSAVFLLPALALAIGVAHLVTRRGRGAGAALALQLGVGVCTAMGLAIWLGIVPRPMDSQIWNSAYPATWWDNLALVVGTPTAAARDLLLVLVVPVLALSRPFHTLVPMISVALIVFFVNPLVGPVWLDLVEPGAHWRLAYLFPVTWCAGLLIPAVARPASAQVGRWPRRAAIAVTVATLVVAFPGSVLRDPTFWHAPWGYKFSPRPLVFARQAVDQLVGRRVLAPPSMVILNLLEPAIKLEAGRPFQTLHAFRNLDRENEGNRRLRAQEVVSGRPINERRAQAFLRSLELGTDALVVRRPALARVSRLLEQHDQRWRISVNTRAYVLLLPIAETAAATPDD